MYYLTPSQAVGLTLYALRKALGIKINHITKLTDFNYSLVRKNELAVSGITVDYIDTIARKVYGITYTQVIVIQNMLFTIYKDSLALEDSNNKHKSNNHHLTLIVSPDSKLDYFTKLINDLINVTDEVKDVINESKTNLSNPSRYPT